MKKGYDPRSIMRTKLLRACLDKGMTAQEILKIIEPLKGMSDEQKEIKANEILQQMQ